MEDKKCSKGYIWITIILLGLNTFFLGGIWCTLKHGCHNKDAFCPIAGHSMSMSPEKMMCPIPSKAMSTPVSQTNP
jgi:hypothetical protein